MRDLDGRYLVTRVKGRPVLERSLRSLLLRVHRFGRHRARTAADVLWTARVADALSVALGDVTQAERAFKPCAIVTTEPPDGREVLPR